MFFISCIFKDCITFTVWDSIFSLCQSFIFNNRNKQLRLDCNIILQTQISLLLLPHPSTRHLQSTRLHPHPCWRHRTSYVSKIRSAAEVPGRARNQFRDWSPDSRPSCQNPGSWRDGRWSSAMCSSWQPISYRSLRTNETKWKQTKRYAKASSATKYVVAAARARQRRPRKLRRRWR